MNEVLQLAHVAGPLVARQELDRLRVQRFCRAVLLTEPRDEELRRASAARLADLAPSHQLFGVPDLVDLEPGKGSEVVGA